MSLGFHSAMASFTERMENVEKYGCNIPWAVLMDPTAACNLKCTGCWAAEYGKGSQLSYQLMDRIIKEGMELGTYTYFFGRRAYHEKKDLIKLAESHQECAFWLLQTARLWMRNLQRNWKRVGNFALAFSIEGYEQETDMRRGEGTYRAVVKAMDILKKEGVVFGFSTCYHSKNVNCVGSDEYVDFLIERDAALAGISPIFR